MKNAFILIGFIFISTTYSQQLEFGFSTGTGSIYMIENSDQYINLNYGTPITIAADLKYTPENAYFGLKFRYQNINASMTGSNWQNIVINNMFFDKIDGVIDNKTIMLLLEHINEKSKFNVGYNFGLGQTFETISFDKKGQNQQENSFLILNFGGLLKYAISPKLALNFETSFLWNDPINSLHVDRYRMAGEDINLLFQIGVSYKLK